MKRTSNKYAMEVVEAHGVVPKVATGTVKRKAPRFDRLLQNVCYSQPCLSGKVWTALQSVNGTTHRLQGARKPPVASGKPGKRASQGCAARARQCFVEAAQASVMADASAEGEGQRVVQKSR